MIKQTLQAGLLLLCLSTTVLAGSEKITFTTFKNELLEFNIDENKISIQDVSKNKDKSEFEE